MQCCVETTQNNLLGPEGRPPFTEISEISHKIFMNATLFFIGMIQTLQICFILGFFFFCFLNCNASNRLHVHPVKFECGVNKTSGLSEMTSTCTPNLNVSMDVLWHVHLTLFPSVNSKHWIPFSRGKPLN